MIFLRSLINTLRGEIMTTLRLKNISQAMQYAIARYLGEIGYKKNEINALLINADINQKPLDYLRIKCPRLFEDEKLRTNLDKTLN